MFGAERPELSMASVVRLERRFRDICSPEKATAYSFGGRVHIFLSELESDGFTSTLAAARPLQRFILSPRIDVDPETELSTEAIKHINGLLASVGAAFLHEAESRRIVELTPGIITPPVRDLPDTLRGTLLELSADQLAMHEDSLRCLTVGSFRPAVVVGWALCIDIVRQWVLRDAERLAALNDRLTKIDKTPVAVYEDFIRLSEGGLLIHLEKADAGLSGFTSKTHQALLALLDKRNNYAHANYLQCSGAKAVACIEEMVDVITGAPFR